MSQGIVSPRIGPRNLRAALGLLPDLAMVPVSRAQAVEAVAPFSNLSYDESNFCCEWDESGQVARGHTNCYGVFFLWAMRLGLLPASFPARLQAAFALAGAAPVLRHYLDAQLRPRPFDDRLPGDWLLFRWNEPIAQRDEEAWGKGRHHVAMVTDLKPLPLGQIFHAVDTDADGDGQVYYANLMAGDAAQVVRVATLPQYDLPQPDLSQHDLSHLEGVMR